MKTKIGFLIAVLSLVVGVGSANAASLNFTNDANVTIGGNSYVIGAGSVASGSLTVNATTLVVTVPAAGTFTIKSVNGYTLTNDASVATTCSSGTTILTLNGAIGPVTITPSTSIACAGGVVSAPSGGAGLTSGGGTTTTTPSSTSTTSTTTTTTSSTLPTTTVAVSNVPIPGCNNGTSGFSIISGVSCANNPVTTPTVIPGCNGNVGFSITSGQSCVNNSTSVVTTTPTGTTGSTTTGGTTGTGTTTTYPTYYNFGTAILKNGSMGSGVKELQRFLNNTMKLGLVVDGKLGPKTIAVIKKWQKANGLVADGLIGPKTKALMNKIAAMQ